MDSSKKNKVLDNFRTECSLGACAQSPYKFYEQKLRLNETPCNSIEKCLGDGYQIPSTTDNDSSIECNRNINTGDCYSLDGNKVQPIVSVITDSSKTECKNLVEGPTIDDIKIKPQECELSRKPYPLLITEAQRIEAAKLCVNRTDPVTNRSKKNVKIKV